MRGGLFKTNNMKELIALSIPAIVIIAFVVTVWAALLRWIFRINDIYDALGEIYKKLDSIDKKTS